MKLEKEELTETIIGAAIEVHRHLGPGFLEAVYEECLGRELELRGLSFRRQVPVPVLYKGLKIECGHKADVVVEGSVVVELKCVEKVLLVHECQLVSYLGGLKLPVGLLLNFYVPLMKDGIYRRVMTERGWRL